MSSTSTMTPDQQFLIDHSLIPPRYRFKTLADLDAPDLATWVLLARRYVEAFPGLDRFSCPGLYISSPNSVGVGKTLMSCAIVQELILGSSVRGQVSYLAFGDLVTTLVDEARGQITDEDAGKLFRLSTSEVIILDDVDKFSGTSNSVYRIQRIIDDLYGRGVVLIVTANVTLNQLVGRFQSLGVDSITAQSIVSRIRGMCQPWTLDLKGKDFRAASRP